MVCRVYAALLLSAGLASGPVRISVEGELVSRPYVRMTIEMVRDFGGRIDETEDGGFLCHPVDKGYALRRDRTGEPNMAFCVQ